MSKFGDLAAQKLFVAVILRCHRDSSNHSLPALRVHLSFRMGSLWPWGRGEGGSEYPRGSKGRMVVPLKAEDIVIELLERLSPPPPPPGCLPSSEPSPRLCGGSRGGGGR